MVVTNFESTGFDSGMEIGCWSGNSHLRLNLWWPYCSFHGESVLQLDRHIARAHDVRRSCATCAEHFSAITQYCSHMRIIHSETTCAYCGSTDTSREHREATHWRRLAEPRSLTVPAQQLQADHEEPTLKVLTYSNWASFIPLPRKVFEVSSHHACHMHLFASRSITYWCLVYDDLKPHYFQ